MMIIPYYHFIMNKRILVIAGMTGLGKSDLAYKIASKSTKQIVVGDSVQLYKNFPIGSNYPRYTDSIQYHLLG